MAPDILMNYKRGHHYIEWNLLFLNGILPIKRKIMNNYLSIQINFYNSSDILQFIHNRFLICSIGSSLKVFALVSGVISLCGSASIS